MKKLKRINIVLLVAGHLLLFVYPLASKTFHVHEVQSVKHCSATHNDNPAVNQQAPNCPICDYQLVSFICEPTFSPSVYRFAYPVASISLPAKVHTEPILHFSLRAPPLA